MKGTIWIMALHGSVGEEGARHARGEIVELREGFANWLCGMKKARPATAAEIASAKKGATKGAKKGAKKAHGS